MESTSQFYQDSRQLLRHLLLPALVLAPLILTAIIYWPGLSGSFILDDRFTLQSLNTNSGVTDTETLVDFVFSSKSGPTGRPVSMLSYLIDDQYFPGDPARYKYTNLMLHLLCGLFLFLLVHQLISCLPGVTDANRLWIAGLTFALWLVHPFNVSTTLYVSQRMTQLMTLFSLAGLYCYAAGRMQLSTNLRKGLILITSALVPLGVLATLSKENGILICLFILVTEFTLLRRLPKDGWIRTWLIVFTVVPLTALCMYFIFNVSMIFNGYESREFSMLERLLTEARILIDYLYHIAIPRSAGTGLIHDDIAISTGLFTPLTTLPSVLLVTALVGTGIYFRHLLPVYSFAVLWFFGGHVLESSFISLELYFEHRNYLPMIGPLFGLVYLCVIAPGKLRDINWRKLNLRNIEWIPNIDWMPRLKLAGKAIPLLLIAVAAFQTLHSARIWGNSQLLFQTWYVEHPDSLRAATMFADRLAAQNRVNESLDILESTYNRHNDAIALPVIMLEIACRYNLPPRMNINEIVLASYNGKFYGIMSQSVTRLINTRLATGCSLVSLEQIAHLMQNLQNIKDLRGPAKGELYLIESDVYVILKRLSPAVETLDEAFKYLKNPVAPLRQAELLLSAGLVKEASQFLEKARQVNNTRRSFDRSYSEEIARIESRLKKN